MTVLMERPGQYVRVSGGQLPPVRRFVLVLNQRQLDEAQQTALGPAAMVLWDPDGTQTHARVRFDWPAPSVAEAVLGAVRLVEQTGLRVVRVDNEDWVTAADVGVRVGRSRETVRLWAAARLGPGGFPPPVNPRRDTTFYSWVEVAPWMRTRMKFDLPDDDVSLVATNLALALRALLPRVPAARAVLELLR